MSWRRRGYGRGHGYGGVRRKLLIGLLALGTLVGYGSGFAHMAGHCRRAEEWRRSRDCPCQHDDRRGPPEWDRGPDARWEGYGPGPWGPREEAWGARNWR